MGQTSCNRSCNVTKIDSLKMNSWHGSSVVGFNIKFSEILYVSALKDKTLLSSPIFIFFIYLSTWQWPHLVKKGCTDSTFRYPWYQGKEISQLSCGLLLLHEEH